jgi:signal transduction histidine kinase
LAIEPQHIAGALERVSDQAAGDLRPNGMQLIFKGRRHAEIATSATEGPEQVRSAELITREGDAIRVSKYTIAVRDTGPGIAESDQQRIFGEFQQVDTSSTKQKGGTGLGLSIAKRIIELHGGTIGLKSTPGSGSTFFFTLPLRVDKQVVGT